MVEVTMLLQQELSKVKVTVKVTDSELTWTGMCDSILTTYSVKSRQILTATVHDNGDSSSVEVSYVNVVVSPSTSVKLQRDSVTFYGPPSQCENVADDVQDLLRRKEGQRPKRILFFMNPNSGWRNSVKQYTNVVAPVFAHCGVHVHAIETQHHDHVTEILSDYDLSSVDVVVSMGGDGSLNQVVTGMLARAAKDAGIDMDHETSLPQRPHIPIGTVPCGSGNAMSIFTNIGRDQETAAYNIVLGHTTHGDVMVVRNQGKFRLYAALQETIGFFGEPMVLMDKLRFLGPRRYNLFPFLMRWYWHLYQMDIQYLPVADDHTSTGEYSKQNTSEHSAPPEWQSCSGLFAGASFMTWKQRDFMRYMKLRRQIAYRRPDVSSGKARMSIFKFRTCWQFMMYMRACATCGIDKYVPDDPTTFEKVAVTEARIRVDATKNGPCRVVLNDGDALEIDDDMDLHIKVCEHALDYICIDHDMVSQAMEYYQP